MFFSTAITTLLVGDNIFLLNKYNYIHFIFVIIPVISIILSIIYRYDKGKLYRNILLSIVIIVLLVSMGLNKSGFELSDYKIVQKYSDVLNIELPKDGKLMEINRENASYMYILFNEDINERIINSDKWINASKLKSELTIFLNSIFTSGDKDNYFLIYNKTTDEYNTLPSKSGEYEIVSCIYSKSKNSLEIDIFTYNYIG